MSFAPYLLFSGQCRSALLTYSAVFDGEITHMATMAETFGDTLRHALHPEQDNWISHAVLDMPQGQLMAADCVDGLQRPMEGAALHIALPDLDRAATAFEALNRGGQTLRPFVPRDHIGVTGCLRDRFGVHWMLSVRPAPATAS